MLKELYRTRRIRITQSATKLMTLYSKIKEQGEHKLSADEMILESEVIKENVYQLKDKGKHFFRKAAAGIRPQSNFGKALVYYQQALALLKQIDNKKQTELHAKVLGNLVEVELRLEQPNEALRHALEMKAMLENPNVRISPILIRKMRYRILRARIMMLQHSVNNRPLANMETFVSELKTEFSAYENDYSHKPLLLKIKKSMIDTLNKVSRDDRDVKRTITRSRRP